MEVFEVKISKKQRKKEKMQRQEIFTPEGVAPEEVVESEYKVEEPAAEEPHIVPFTSSHISLKEFVNKSFFTKHKQCVCGKCQRFQYNCFKFINTNSNDTSTVVHGYGYGKSQRINELCDKYNSRNEDVTQFCLDMYQSQKDTPLFLIPISYEDMTSVLHSDPAIEAQQFLRVLIEKFISIATSSGYSAVHSHFNDFNYGIDQQVPYFSLSQDLISNDDKNIDYVREETIGENTYRVRQYVSGNRGSCIQSLATFLERDQRNSIVMQLIVPDARFVQKIDKRRNKSYIRYSDIQFTPFVRGKLQRSESMKEGLMREAKEELGEDIAKLFIVDDQGWFKLCKISA